MGLSYLSFDDGSGNLSKTGWGFTAGLGYDLRVGRNVSISPCFNYIYGNVGDFPDGTSGNHGDLFQVALGVTFH